MNAKELRELTDAELGVDVGCGDGSCVFGYRGGMHTNGGCECMRGDRERVRLTAHRLRRLLLSPSVQRKGSG